VHLAQLLHSKNLTCAEQAFGDSYGQVRLFAILLSERQGHLDRKFGVREGTTHLLLPICAFSTTVNVLTEPLQVKSVAAIRLAGGLERLHNSRKGQ
jgi:hypothetical protein